MTARQRAVRGGRHLAMSRFYRGACSWWGVGLVVLLGSALALLAARQREEGVWVVEKDVEETRDAPDGKKVGTLSEGTEIEKIGQDGNWVRFRVEGWIWGPSLAGFTREKAVGDRKQDGRRDGGPDAGCIGRGPLQVQCHSPGSSALRGPRSGSRRELLRDDWG